MLRCAVILLSIVLAYPALAETKIAVIRAAEVYSKLDATKRLNAEIEAERKEVYASARYEAYREAFTALQALRKRLVDNREADPATRQRMEREYALKRREALTLQREYEEFRKKRTREINTKLVARMKETLEQIQHAAAQIGKKHQIDWVLDISGNTNTGSPFVVYAKAPLDLTSEVLAAMGVNASETAGESSE